MSAYEQRIAISNNNNNNNKKTLNHCTLLTNCVQTAVQDWELNDHKGIITSICVDNGLLFSAGYDKIIRCYDLKVGQKVLCCGSR